MRDGQILLDSRQKGPDADELRPEREGGQEERRERSRTRRLGAPQGLLHRGTH